MEKIKKGNVAVRSILPKELATRDSIRGQFQWSQVGLSLQVIGW